MYWNYRVIRDPNPEVKDKRFWIGEVYYKDDGTPTLYTGPLEHYGETVEELADTVSAMHQALLKPYLDVWVIDKEPK